MSRVAPGPEHGSEHNKISGLENLTLRKRANTYTWGGGTSHEDMVKKIDGDGREGLVYKPQALSRSRRKEGES